MPPRLPTFTSLTVRTVAGNSQARLWKVTSTLKCLLKALFSLRPQALFLGKLREWRLQGASGRLKEACSLANLQQTCGRDAYSQTPTRKNGVSHVWCKDWFGCKTTTPRFPAIKVMQTSIHSVIQIITKIRSLGVKGTEFGVLGQVLTSVLSLRSLYNKTWVMPGLVICTTVSAT